MQTAHVWVFLWAVSGIWTIWLARFKAEYLRTVNCNLGIRLMICLVHACVAIVAPWSQFNLPSVPWGCPCPAPTPLSQNYLEHSRLSLTWSNPWPPVSKILKPCYRLVAVRTLWLSFISIIFQAYLAWYCLEVDSCQRDQVRTKILTSTCGSRLSR